MEALFVYGTLQDAQVQGRVFGRVVMGQADRLDGWLKAAIKLGDTVYPIAVEEPDSAIDGQVIEVSVTELIDIDRYEGEAYRRIRVTLQSGRAAWVYCK